MTTSPETYVNGYDHRERTPLGHRTL